MSKISFIALGGIGAIGMNCYVYETEKSAVIIDCGVKFFDDNVGIDKEIPDLNYLETIKHKDIICVLTHGHEDHIGAIKYLIERYKDLTVATTRYTFELIKHKLESASLKVKHKIYFDTTPKISITDIDIEFIPISHSIPETGAIHLRSHDGFTVLHVSDYKIDFNPYNGTPFKLKPFLDVANQNLNCLVADSTNVLSRGFTKSEKFIKQNLTNIIKTAEGRVFFTTFTSNIERLQQVFDIATETDKYIVIEGSSFTRSIALAKQLSKIKIDDSRVITRKAMANYDKNKIIILATGSQGERMSIMNKISYDDYININVCDTDSFIFSSRVIPGNEHRLIEIKNRLYRYGAKVYSDRDNSIHVSGHGSSSDTLFLIKLLRPDYLIPIHGEYMHLQGHKKIAVDNNLVDENSVLIIDTGDKVTFNDGELVEIEKIELEKSYIDSFSKSLLNLKDLKERVRVSMNGAISITLLINIQKNSILYGPYISVFGLSLSNTLRDNLKEFIVNSTDNGIFERTSVTGWHTFIVKSIKKYFKKNYNRDIAISINIEEV